MEVSTTTVLLFMKLFIVTFVILLSSSNNNNVSAESTVDENTIIIDRRPGIQHKKTTTPTTTTSNRKGEENANTQYNIFRQQGGATPRIIGGSDAAPWRYPYMVSLTTMGGRSVCGGTLIAPDVVLTAAHCSRAFSMARIGEWDRNTPLDDHEEIQIDSPEYIHPLYDSSEFPYDFMLLKLEQQSTKQFVKLNDNPNKPTGNVNDELTTIGFGLTNSADDGSTSRILQEVELTYVPNDICDQAKAPGFFGDSYQGLITDDMLCANDDGQDSCQGDSGGPLIIRGGSGNTFNSDDVLVGVVSWGFGCALESFPGVYGRISDQIDWIRSVTCQISDNPPSDFQCNNLPGDSNNVVDPGVPGNPGGIDGSVPVTIVIQFDDFPEEIGWSISVAQTGATIIEVPAGTYSGGRSRVQETVFLPAGYRFFFTMEDTYGDGLCCNVPGNFMLFLGKTADGEVLLNGGGEFGNTLSLEFETPADYNDEEEEELFIGENQIPLTIVIQLDNFPSEIGWRVDRLGIEVEEVIRVPAGIYTSPGEKIVRTVVLDEDELYYFGIYDVVEDGISGGYVQLYLGTTDTDDESMLFHEISGDFQGGADVTFIASLDGAETDAPVVSDFFITLEIQFDLYPEEIGLQLRAANTETAIERQAETREDTIIFFRPPRHYAGKSNEVVVEQIPIPKPSVGAYREFTFIITDSYGDGVCCNWNGELDTGYTIYQGDPSDGIVLAESNFEGTKREVKTFVIERPDELQPTTSPIDGTVDGETVPPQPSVNIKVSISLDAFPDETGFYIQDRFNNKVFEVPAGTYREEFKLVEETVSLDVGVYTLTLTDAFGDGINRDGSFFQVDLVDEPNRPHLLKGNGVFVSQLSQVFILEGDAAQYPMTISFTTDDKPREFGFSVKRLDLFEADAYVASLPQGTYEAPQQEISESLMVREGGVYRVYFEDSGRDGIGGDVEILIGSTNPNDVNAISYMVDGRDLQDWQVKLLAGTPPVVPKNPKTVDLRIQFDGFPHELEWILVSSPVQNARALRDHEVVAYGPQELYTQNLENMEHIETIPLPDFSGEKQFTMIITDSEGDGLCCEFGNGGPVELFDGPVDSGVLLFSNPFNGTARIVETFVLEGSGNDGSSSANVFSTRISFFFVSAGLLLFAAI